MIVFTPIKKIPMNTFEVGDHWTFPREFKWYEITINGRVIPYIYVQVTNPYTKEKCRKKFFPSIMLKTRTAFSEDGRPLKRVFTDGTAAESFRNSATIEDAMNSMRGKKVWIHAMRFIRSKIYTTEEFSRTQIPTIDFV